MVRMCVVSGCCCKEVYKFPHITSPYSTCISSFLQQHLYFVHFKNVFSFLFMLFLCNMLTWQYNYIVKHVNYKSQDFHVQGTDNGIIKISLLHVCTGET